MLCINCGKNQATTHIKQTINGKTNVYHLCSDCAKKLGMSDFDPFDISDLWSSLFENQMPDISKTLTCQSCGSTYNQIAKRGKLGCPECYATFKSELMPSLRRMHGKTRHIGKVPGKVEPEVKTVCKIDRLKNELSEAVGKEDYESAAKLRDEIKLLQNKEKESEQNG